MTPQWSPDNLIQQMKWGSLCAAVPLLLVLSAPAQAGPARACIEAASRAQFARDDNRLLQSRKELQSCAIAACPALIRADCAQWLQDVDKRIPTVVVVANDAHGVPLTDVVVTIDGAPPPPADNGVVALDVGSHVFRFDKPGFKPVEQTVTLAASQKARAVVAVMEPIRVEPPPPPPPAPRPSPPPPPSPARRVPVGSWIGWGVGAVGLAGFGVFGVQSNLDYSSLKDSCGGACDPADRDSLKTTMLLADVSLVVGLLGAGIGTVLYLMQPGATPKRGQLEALPGGKF